MWVRNRLMRLGVELRWADRNGLFEEFFPNDPLILRISSSGLCVFGDIARTYFGVVSNLPGKRCS
jgi:hypothetical protein